ncbi:MAG: hypothetical protein NTY02_20320 [Acidobacteria bacterium]|nr:hypothetical protein [Acidobacteriota bacterium]
MADNAPIDMSQVKQQLQLPDSATPDEVVAAMLQVIAQLTAALQDAQTQYKAAVDQLAEHDVAVANRTVEDFADVIGQNPEQKDFWTQNVIVNREAAVASLTQLRADKTAPAAAEPPAAGAPPPEKPAPAPRTPLKNRIGSEPRTIQDIATGATMTREKAVTIRNRAQAISRERGIPFNRAFDLARTELSK